MEITVKPDLSLLCKNSPTVGDVDGDGKLEIILAFRSESSEGFIYALNGEDGSILWYAKIKDESYSFSSPTLADFNGDGMLEIIVCCDNEILVLEGKDGSLLWSYKLNSRIYSSPALEDIDGDRKLEVVIGSDDGNVYALDPEPSGRRVYWQGLHGDPWFNSTRCLTFIDPDMDFLSSYSEAIYGTKPNDADTDDDGLLDGLEVYYGTDLFDADTDDDGLPDGWEVHHGTKPTVPDANEDYDSDGLTNLEEYEIGTEPTKADTDGDGMPDGWEVKNGLNPLANDANEDYDSDGLTNLEEYMKGTSPSKADTDGDFLPDGYDLLGLIPFDYVPESILLIHILWLILAFAYVSRLEEPARISELAKRLKMPKYVIKAVALTSEKGYVFSRKALSNVIERALSEGPSTLNSLASLTGIRENTIKRFLNFPKFGDYYYSKSFVSKVADISNKLISKRGFILAEEISKAYNIPKDLSSHILSEAGFIDLGYDAFTTKEVKSRLDKTIKELLTDLIII